MKFKRLKYFFGLLKILWMDKVDVAMLTIWAGLVVYFFIVGNDMAGGALGFFWVYGFTSILRLCEIKRIANDGE